MATIEAAETPPASRDAVWALLADAPAWARWGSWSKVEVEGGGAQGPGQVRVLVRRPYRLRERITEWGPGGGTVVRWRSTYEHAGPFTAFLLRSAVRDACKRLAKAASAEAAPA